jgi:hypothetical protein
VIASGLMKAAAGSAAAVLLAIGPAGAAGASTGWVIQRVPVPAGAHGAYLQSVSCVSGGACLAVGDYAEPGAKGKLSGQPYAVRKTAGTGWKVLTLAPPAGLSTGSFTGVSCASASFCAAVGYYTSSTTNATEPLAETWNGTAWSVQSIPVPAGSGLPELYGVSCASPTVCMAVGTYTTTSGEYNWAVAWNGTSWATVPTASEPGTDADALQGVSCPSVSSCMAVGVDYPTTGPGEVLVAESWNGSTWTNTSVQKPAGVKGSLLWAVSCSSASACTIIGDNLAPGTAADSALAERWNGTSWSIQAITGEVMLTGVSCPTAGSCTAVGQRPENATPPVAYTWTRAGGWVTTTPATPSGATSVPLNGVSCLSATTCTVAGGWGKSGTSQARQPLAEQE